MNIFKRDKKIRCHLLEGSYDILVGTNILHQSGKLIEAAVKPKPTSVMVVTNKKVAAFYEKIVKASLKRAGFKTVFHYVPDSETAKSDKALFSLMRAFVRAGLERGSLVIALGGGVVGDLAGFAASIYMRGIRFVNIPTTLLAQVDSAIGGKTGINLKEGKNLVGTFYQPRLVLSDVATTATLPKKEIVGGLAEVIKYSVLFDPEFFNFLEENIDSILDLDLEIIEKVVFKCSQYKVKIVERDEKETELRAVLNLGHTFAHAIEAHANYKTLTHGMAVGLGMQAAGRLANRLGMFDDEPLERLIQLLEQTGLPTSLSSFKLNSAKLLKLMYSDKKVQKKKIRLVLPMEIGSVVIRDDISPALIKQALKF